MIDLFDYALSNCDDSDMVGVTIGNEVNMFDKAIGISFRRKVAQLNARYNALDKFIVVVHSVKMPVGFERKAVRSMGRPYSVLAHLKHSIIEVKADTNCLIHALIIAIA